MILATEEGRRTAFNAAYLMGDHGRDLFAWLAGEDLPAARRAAVFSLYLRWRRDRQYVFDLLDLLSGQVGLPPIWRRGRVLRFLGDLSVTIYVNHPYDEEMVGRMAELWRRVLRGRLHLDRLLFLLRAPMVGHLQAVLAVPTLRTAILAEVQDPEAFFGQGPEERQRFLRTVPLADPAERFGTDPQIDDLAALLESRILLHRILAALVIGIHGVSEPEGTQQIVEKLSARLGGMGLLWAVLAYSIPLPGTPEAWVSQLESLTSALLERSRETFLGDNDEFVSRFDIGLLPLGLAYGKRGRGMPLFDAWLERGLHGGPSDDRALAMRTIRGLAAVGVYFPHAVFQTLRVCVKDLARDDTADALVGALAGMRALHFDAVDLFLQQVGASDEIRDRVSRQDDSGLVSHCVQWLGYFSNAVHVALNYPILRRSLLIGGLETLGEARRASDFTRAYTATLLRLLEESDFDLIRWAQRDAPS